MHGPTVAALLALTAAVANADITNREAMSQPQQRNLPAAIERNPNAPIHQRRAPQQHNNEHDDDAGAARQHPLMDPNLGGPGPALPQDPSRPGATHPGDPSAPEPGGPGAVVLSDVMGRDRSINVFAGFARDVEAVARRLDDGAQNSTVLAPLNSAIEALPRKPWEDPREYSALGADAYEGQDGRERAQANLRLFVEAHLVPASPWREGERVTPVSGDREIWWETVDGKKVIRPGDIEVVNVAGSVSNGEVWIVKSVRNYAETARPRKALPMGHEGGMRP